MKNNIKFILSFIMIIILSFSIVYVVAEDPGTTGDGDGPSKPIDNMDTDSYRVSESRTRYKIIVPTGVDAEGKTTYGSINIYLQDGEKGAGNMQGYGSTGGDTMDSNPLPTGKIDIYAEDIAEVCRQQGYTEIADAIDAR